MNFLLSDIYLKGTNVQKNNVGLWISDAVYLQELRIVFKFLYNEFDAPYLLNPQNVVILFYAPKLEPRSTILY